MSPIESALLMFCTLAVTFQSQPFSALLYEYLAEHYSKPGAPMTVEEAWKQVQAEMDGSVATSSASASETSKKKKPAKPAAKKTTKKRKHESEEEGSDDDIVTKPKSKGKKQKSSRAKGKERDSDVEGSDAEPAEQEEGEEEEHESQPAPPAVNLGNGSEPISILHLAASVNAPPSNGKKKQATMDTYGSKK